MITFTLIITGVATVYAAPYIDETLYCDRGQGLVFGPRTPPWVAVDVQMFLSGRIRCGDELWLGFGSPHQTLKVLALDAGPFHGYYVQDWPHLPIVADIPFHLVPFSGLASPVRIFNYSAAQRALNLIRLYRKPRPSDSHHPVPPKSGAAALKTARADAFRLPQEGVKERRPLVPGSRYRTARRAQTTAPHESHGHALTPMIRQHGVVRLRMIVSKSHYQMLSDMVEPTFRLLNDARQTKASYPPPPNTRPGVPRTGPRRFLMAQKGNRR